jgi:hypothetical protein
MGWGKPCCTANDLSPVGYVVVADKDLSTRIMAASGLARRCHQVFFPNAECCTAVHEAARLVEAALRVIGAALMQRAESTPLYNLHVQIVTNMPIALHVSLPLNAVSHLCLSRVMSRNVMTRQTKIYSDDK